MVQELIAKAEVLVEALPFLQRHAGKTFVIKYGGSFMDSPDRAVRDGVARDVVFLAAAGIRPVIVHGGGKAITRAMGEAGLPANFIQGQRVTDAATAAVVERVLSKEINPGIVAAITSLGGRARGFSGTRVFRCRKFVLPGAGGDLGYVGQVDAVDLSSLGNWREEGVIPVISPTALGAEGAVYNCNADVAAAQAAIALKAEKLIFMSDVPGLMGNLKDAGSLISSLPVGDVAGLKQSGVIDQGMIPKVDSAVTALESGVGAVSFIDGRLLHSLLLPIFSATPLGTEIVR